MSRLDRLQRDTTDLPGCRFALVDGLAFVAQWRAIFIEEHYAFAPERSDPRILDCGANVGLASLYWARKFPGARITAFEPDPALATVLRANLRACQATEVEVVEAAVWSANGAVDFTTGSPDAGRVLRGAASRVHCVRLRDYLNESVDLLKLDIEGAETEVLSDCADRLSRVDRVFVEFHSFEDRDQRLDALISILADAGFRMQIVTERASSQPFLEPLTYFGMDLQLNIYAYRP